MGVFLHLNQLSNREIANLNCLLMLEVLVKKKKLRCSVKYWNKLVSAGLCYCLLLYPVCVSIVWGGPDLSSFRACISIPAGAQPHAEFRSHCHSMCQSQDAPVSGCSPSGGGHRSYGLPFLCPSHYPPLWSGNKGKITSWVLDEKLSFFAFNF